MASNDEIKELVPGIRVIGSAIDDVASCSSGPPASAAAHARECRAQVAALCLDALAWLHSHGIERPRGKGPHRPRLA